MASVIKVDQIQSDTGTLNVYSNIRFTGTNTLSFAEGQGLNLGTAPAGFTGGGGGQLLNVDGNVYLGNNGPKIVGVHSGNHVVLSADADVYIVADMNATGGTVGNSIYLGGGSNVDTDANTSFNYDNITFPRDAWMTIGPYGVQMPKQPAFSAYRTTAFSIDSSSKMFVICDNAVTNIGSNYNTSNGRFTAPLNGTYFFTGTVSMEGGDASNDDTGGIFFAKNGTNLGTGQNGVNPMFHTLINPQRWTVSGQENSWSVSAILTLNAGDYINFVIGDLTTTSITVDAAVFSGFLIG